MKQAQKRKRGGQPKPAAQRKRNNLTIRVLDQLRERLEIAARVSGRSMSEEAAHRMMLGFTLENELTDYAKIKEANDELLATLAVKRGWATLVDVRYGGFILVPHGQMASRINELINPGAETATRQEIEKALVAALPPTIEATVARAVEKAVAAALTISCLLGFVV